MLLFYYELVFSLFLIIIILSLSVDKTDFVGLSFYMLLFYYELVFSLFLIIIIVSLRLSLLNITIIGSTHGPGRALRAFPQNRLASDTSSAIISGYDVPAARHNLTNLEE